MRKIILAAVVLCASISVAALAAETTVTQSHTSFDTDAVTIKAGDSIVFANKDDVTHNVQISNEDGEDDDKGLQKPGQDIKAVFAKAGQYKIHCSIHPKMKMTVTVQ